LRTAHTCSERWHGAADGFSHGTETHERELVCIAIEEAVADDAGRTLSFLRWIAAQNGSACDWLKYPICDNISTNQK
jgi:hypothetical protein